MRRRRLLAGLLIGAAPNAESAQAQAPAPPNPPRFRPRQREARAEEPIALLPEAELRPLPPPQRGEAAPVPNREIELPAVRYTLDPKLAPEVFRSRMPGRSVNTDGAVNQREERVYSPAAGARLTLPFFTR